jgi:hypothetical protein
VPAVSGMDARNVLFNPEEGHSDGRISDTLDAACGEHFIQRSSSDAP